MPQRVVREESLAGLLEEVRDGRIQGSELQRDLVLDDDAVGLLLASVSQGYPIGAVTMLDIGTAGVRFDVGPIPGAPSPSREPERLLLDGQHRLSCLFQALASDRGVQTRDAQNQTIERWYSFDMKSALDSRVVRDEAVVSVLELGSEESEWEQCHYPLRLVFGADVERRSWRRGFAEYGGPGDVESRLELLDRFEVGVLAAFAGYLMPTITVGPEWVRWAMRVHGGADGRDLSDRFTTR
jgi:hypothetical protein